jgi:DNA polymerase-3 subunit alpha
MESLIMAGAFDFDVHSHRAQWFEKDPRENNITNLEKAIRYGGGAQDAKNSQQVSLFGEASAVEMPAPKFQPSQPWSELEKLRNEKDVVGFYVSGHPLDTFRFEIDAFCNVPLNQLSDLTKLRGKDIAFAGIDTSANHRVTKTGKPFGTMFIEDYTGSLELALFSDDYLKFKQYLTTEYYLFIRAKVQSRFNDPNNLEIKISSVKMLPDVGNEFAKSLTLSLELEEINAESVNTLDILLKEYPGKLPVKFSVRDKDTRVELASKKVRVDFSKKLFEELEFKQGIRFKINM